MTSVVVVQARTNSSRLPAKALLNLGGYPLVVLAAKRAATTGERVIVATSSEPSDDALADTLARHDIEYYRGDLNDTLSRFIGALQELDDDTTVIRLTADNVFPDGNLLKEMKSTFLSEDLEYLSCGGGESGLPYGLSVEIMRLRHLREADRESVTWEDREHVTPYIIRKYQKQAFTKFKGIEMSHFRCTIDSLDDFVSVSKIFEGVSDPVNVKWSDLLTRLPHAPGQPIVRKPLSRFLLGGAQFGSRYGVANQGGQPAADLACRIIRTAIVNGIQGIDTARAYGVSEDVIGEALSNGWASRTRVFSKLSPLDDCPLGASTQCVHRFVDASVFRSLASLKLQKIDVLMLHRASHLSQWNGEAWRRLLALRDEGWIGTLGVSIQNPEDLANALADADVAHIQMPVNILDWRWRALESTVLAAKKSRPLVTHARSVFLQGLLPSRDIGAWQLANVVDPAPVWNWLENTARNLGKASVAELCLSYVAGLPWIDGTVVGLENERQLDENIALFGTSPLSQDDLEEISRTRPTLGENSLDPSLWAKH